MPTHATKSGNYIPVSQLGSGTPTGSKYLRDDGTWAVLPGGGGGGAWGGITGTLSDQTDLQSALDAKSGTGHNHTGTYQPLATVLTNTTASFTTAQETKLSGVATGAEVNVNADWNSVAGDSQILNKPSLGGSASLNVGTSAGTVAAGDHNHTGVYQPLATVLTNTTAAFTTAQETKLSGIATGATANSSDATLLARANHTGTQTASTISDFNTSADARISAAVINALSDVVITTPANGQVLKYDGANWINGTDATGGGGDSLSTTTIAFTDGDTLRRVTVTDGTVSATSKILGTVIRPDTTDDSADPGYMYLANVVKRATGSFDLLISCLGWGFDDPTQNPPNETITYCYKVTA